MIFENVTGFPPVISGDCKVLILGSIPSIKSRETGFYYGNKTNRFWRIISEIFGEDFTVFDNKRKAEELLKHNVGLYDVFASCKILGSSDGKIKNAELNDIPSLIKNTEITRIYVTSQKAYKVFIKRYGEYFDGIGVKIVNLPSPSSANRSKFRTDEELINKWKTLFIIN